MLRVVDRLLGHGPRWRVIAVGLAFILVIGILDHHSGSEIGFSIFYLVPVSLVSWYCGRRAGFVMCALSAASWLAVDMTTHEYSARWIPYWNACSRLMFFCLIAYLLADLRGRLEREHEQARTDALTGVRNSRAFAEQAQLMLSLAARSGRPVALGYIDVDNFKVLNDSLGHAEGDRVLGSLCAVMRRSLRSTDIIGRVGGDEFVILLPETDMASAKGVFESLHERLANEIRAAGWPIGISIGVAVFHGTPPDVHAAVQRADALMYEVKRGSKGGIAYAEFATAKGGVQMPASRAGGRR